MSLTPMGLLLVILDNARIQQSKSENRLFLALGTRDLWSHYDSRLVIDADLVLDDCLLK